MRRILGERRFRMTTTAFFQAVRDWAAQNPQIDSVILVGSHARGTNHAGSDVDLVVLTAEKPSLLRDRGWTAQFGGVLREQVEEYGACTSVRVWYEDGREVEFGLVLPDWAAVPLDEGTAGVLRDGYRVLADRAGHFAALEIPPLAQ